MSEVDFGTGPGPGPLLNPGSASLLFPVDPGSATPVGHLMEMISRISEDPTGSEHILGMPVTWF